MADWKQTEIDIPVLTLALEQKMAANLAITGVAPSLAGEIFTPYSSDVDGIIRYKQHDNTANDEADLGGLFTLSHKQPGVLEWVMLDLGAAVLYTVSIVTSAGTWQVATDTAQYIILAPKAPILPGEKVKITAAAPGAGKKSWMRVYLRSDQARH
jgi:hypothetical protein